MKRLLAVLFFLPALAQADYSKGLTMFQIYGGGSAFTGKYDRSAVPKDQRAYSDIGGMIGGQFLYFIQDRPCVAVGFDVAHTNGGDQTSGLLLTDRYTRSSLKSTQGLAVARLSYPKGHYRPYVQVGLGAHHTRLHLDGAPIHSTVWADTSTTETRDLYSSGHTSLAAGGAIGLHVYFTERVYIGTEYKMTMLFGNDFKPTRAGVGEGFGNTNGNISAGSLGFMLGLGF